MERQNPWLNSQVPSTPSSSSLDYELEVQRALLQQLEALHLSQPSLNQNPTTNNQFNVDASMYNHVNHQRNPYLNYDHDFALPNTSYSTLNSSLPNNPWARGLGSLSNSYLPSPSLDELPFLPSMVDNYSGSWGGSGLGLDLGLNLGPRNIMSRRLASNSNMLNNYHNNYNYYNNAADVSLMGNRRGGRHVSPNRFRPHNSVTRPSRKNDRYFNNNNNNNNYNNGYYNRRKRASDHSNDSSSEDSYPLAMELLPSWENLKGKVVTYAKDERGCQDLYWKLKKGERKEEGIKMIISEIREEITGIIMNKSGCYFFKKLLKFVDVDDITEILRAVMQNQQGFLAICLDHDGSYAIQKLIQVANKNDKDHRSIVLSAVLPIVLTLCKDLYGQHVVPAILRKFVGVQDVVAPILEKVADDVVSIAMNKSGCCMLQKCLMDIDGKQFVRDAEGNYMHEVEKRARERLLFQLKSHSLRLSQDEYGNYVVQYVIHMDNDKTNSEIIRMLEGSFVYLSMHKYGSHVVEKLLNDVGDGLVIGMIKEITEDPNFLKVLQNERGNYVGQTLIRRTKVMPGCIHDQLINRITSYRSNLRYHEYGRKVLMQLNC